MRLSELGELVRSVFCPGQGEPLQDLQAVSEAYRGVRRRAGNHAVHLLSGGGENPA